MISCVHRTKREVRSILKMRKPIDEETNGIILVAIVAIACLVWYLFAR